MLLGMETFSKPLFAIDSQPRSKILADFWQP